MSKTRTFKFGNGGVAVYGWANGYVELVQIKPPFGYVSENFNKDDLKDKEELYRVKIQGDVLQVVKNDLLNIDKPKILKYDDFILDFTDYNVQSVNIVLKAINVSSHRSKKKVNEMTFSEFIVEEKNERLQEGVAVKLDQMQADGTLEATVILSGQIWLTERYFEYKELL